MKQVRLGSAGPLVSALGLGCMRMSDRHRSADPASVATIHAALAAGVNFLDTGDFYGMGHNEQLVGQAIHDRRDKAFISVKFGAMWSPKREFLGADCRPRAVKNFAAYSLQRLGVDHIDLYQPGRADPAVPIEETVGAISELIKDGKVRFLGLSEVTAANLRRAHAVHPVAALEIEYSLATRFIETEILSTARELGIAVVAYNVLSHGLLNGRLRADPRPPAGLPSPRFQPENLEHNLRVVEHLDQLAKQRQATPAQIATAWVLSRGDDIVALLGMATTDRLRENLAALDVALTAAELSALDRTFAADAMAGDRAHPAMRAFQPG